MQLEIGNGAWNESEGGVVRPKKQTEWDTVDHWHVRDDGLLSNDWLEEKKTGLHYKRDVCDARVVSRPEMFVYNDILLKSKWSRNQWHTNEKKSTFEFEQME